MNKKIISSDVLNTILATEEYIEQQIGDISNLNTEDKTIIGAINELKTNKADKSELFSGSYNDLTNKPVIPSIQGLASESYVNNKLSNLQLLRITQEDYNTLVTKDPNTLYIIVE